MNSNKKSTPARGVPQSSKGHSSARQFKPLVAQLKTGVSAHSVKRPVAPPVYRPQPVPKVLQTKRAPGQSPHSLQAPRQPVASPVYRQEVKKIVQPKVPRTPSPAYRPEQKRIAQPKMTSAAQTRGVIQRDLADDFHAKKINVAIVGEHHHEIKEGEETAEWGKHGIRVFYEGDSLTDSVGSDLVTPDPSLLRLSFAWTSLIERVKPYLEKVAKPGAAAVAGFDDADFVLNYLIPVLVNDCRQLKHQDDAFGEALKMLKELKDLLKGKRSQNLAGGEEWMRVTLARKLLRDFEGIGKIIGGVHSTSPFKAVAYRSVDLRVERSRQMLLNVNQFAGRMENTIYKVGNHHVLDMVQHRHVWPLGRGVGVFDRQQYLAEYQSLKRKPSKPSGVVSSPSPKPSVVVSSPSPSPSVVVSSASARPSGLSSHKPSGVVSSPSPSPSVVVSGASARPSGLSSHKPSGVVSSPSPSPSVVVSSASARPSGLSSHKPSGLASSPSPRPSGLASSPSPRPSAVVSSPKPKREFRVAPPRPIWIPDASRPNCSSCYAEFGLFTRRHHCRVCGEVFCSQCCSQKRNVPPEEQAVEPGKSPAAGPVLVCDGCF